MNVSRRRRGRPRKVLDAGWDGEDEDDDGCGMV